MEITNNSKDVTKINGPGSKLLKVCLKACYAMTPLIRAIYNDLCDSLVSKTKEEIKEIKPDNTIFTIADGLVQYFLKDILFQGLFEGIVGEESSNINIRIIPYTVGEMVIPEKYTKLINDVKESIKNLQIELHPNFQAESEYKDKYVFIDPIDGTKEFATGKGFDSTICIGFSNADGSVFAGIVYRPIPLEKNLEKNAEKGFFKIKQSDLINNDKGIPTGVTYASGCKEESFKDINNLDLQNTKSEKLRLLTSRGTTSNFLKNLDFNKVESGGAGNKMLNILEGKGDAYIQDRGVSRWDTCAAQAVIEACGGVCCKLTDFLNNNGDIVSYKYIKDGKNEFDVITKPKFTSINIIDTLLDEYNDKISKGKPKVKLEVLKYEIKTSNTNNKKNKFQKEINNIDYKNTLKQFLSEQKVSIENFKPYANLCGIVAFLYPENNVDKKEEYKQNMLSICNKSAVTYKPEYN